MEFRICPNLEGRKFCPLKLLISLDKNLLPCDDASMININEMLDLYQYCQIAANELIDDAATYLDTQHPFDDPIALARSISADQLESAAFTNTAAFAHDSDAAMIITYETICAIIRNLTNCSYDDICAEY